VSLGLIAATLLPFVISPGASFTITVGAATEGDRRASLRVWAGTALGIASIAVVAALSGLADYVASSQTARTAFGLVGGAVLLGLAVGAGLRARTVLTVGITETRPKPRLVLWAFLALITNVKALSLYAVVLPAALIPGANSLRTYALCAATHTVMLLAWLTLVGALVRRTPVLRSSPRARAALFSVTALAMAALGVRSIVDVI
jgi:threonine/homoserine/homoserine lactone efflux protein